jgi:hypothetical protein
MGKHRGPREERMADYQKRIISLRSLCLHFDILIPVEVNC